MACAKRDSAAYCHPDLFQPVSPLVYHNDGNGHFTEVAASLGLAKPGKGLGIALADYDRDGHVRPFHAANDSMPEFLYHNKGNGTFEEVALTAGVAVDGDGHTFAGMGVDFADYNNDGLPDLLVTDLANQMYALYQNDGSGNFDYVTGSSRLGNITLSHSGWGVRFLDYDNDGWKDLLIAQGHDIDTIERQFLNCATASRCCYSTIPAKASWMSRQIQVASSSRHGSGRGLAVGDINNDGRVDAVVTTNDGSAHVLYNQTSTRQPLAGVDTRRTQEQPGRHRR